MKIASVKGFHDVLPGDSARWAWLETRARDLFARYHFAEIRIPIVERTELFARSIGDTTDIVEKEMYSFVDRDGTSLTLRPEGTAGVVRAYVEHALWQKEPVSKLFYFGPMFRRERPQKGRLRQFHQMGAEVLGRDDPAIDAEVLMLLHDLLLACEIRHFTIELNSLGDANCRPAYREAVRAYGETHRSQLCDNCQRRLERNPLRLLDCKVPTCAALMAEAPVMEAFWCNSCREHFAAVRQALDHARIPYVLAPRIVRGLDYYVRTAFEVKAEGLGAQNAVGGGGRYDGLVKSLDGPDVPGIGFALGVERMLLALGMAVDEQLALAPEIFLAPLGAESEAHVLVLAHRWRNEGLKVELGAAARSLKSQMRQADKSGAPFVLIVGEAELESRAATVRDMLRKRDYPRAVAFDWSAGQVRQYLASLGEVATPQGQELAERTR
jgi:histidyl-tRNA synthetase